MVVDLPVMPPVKPMLAKSVRHPDPAKHEGLIFEPKWDEICSVLYVTVLWLLYARSIEAG